MDDRRAWAVFFIGIALLWLLSLFASLFLTFGALAHDVVSGRHEAV